MIIACSQNVSCFSNNSLSDFDSDTNFCCNAAKLNCIEEDDTGNTTLNIVELYSCLKKRKHCCKVESSREQVVAVVMIIIIIVVGTYERGNQNH